MMNTEKQFKIRMVLSLATMLGVFAAFDGSVRAADYFTDDGFNAPIKTMQHPSSEYYNGVTYIAYSKQNLATDNFGSDDVMQARTNATREKKLLC
jgi:hypothetical protein